MSRLKPTVGLIARERQSILQGTLAGQSGTLLCIVSKGRRRAPSRGRRTDKNRNHACFSRLVIGFPGLINVMQT